MATPSQGIPEILTVEEAAAYLKLPVSTIYRLAERRQLPAHKVGRQWRFSRAAIDQWLQERSSMPAASILVVDDEAPIRDLLSQALGGHNRRILTAQNGLEALDVLESSKVDLILLDLKMPELDGAETFGKIRARGIDTPVILITGFPESEVMNRALESGPFTVISKPVDINQLRKVVELALGR